MKLRKATVVDIPKIHKFVNEFAKSNQMLPRALNDLYDNIRDLIVYESDGVIMGVCALHVLWEDLAEIRSLAVAEGFQRKGIGAALVKQGLKEAKALGIKKVLALTYKPEFFITKFGFAEVNKNDLPHKIWGDCLHCPKFPECDEVAVLKHL